MGKRKVRAVKECYFCMNYIKARLDDLCDDGWMAYQMQNQKVKCFCPLHIEEGKLEMRKDLQNDVSEKIEREKERKKMLKEDMELFGGWE